MHKSAVKYEQSRTTRAATNAVRNEHFDVSAFAGGERAEYDRLTGEKRALETDIQELKARITRAKALAWEKRIYTNVKTYQRWEFEKVAKSRQIQVIEDKLAALKREMGRGVPAKVDWSPDQRSELHSIFYAMAKEMLADAVFERVRIAALHRFSDQRHTASCDGTN